MADKSRYHHTTRNAKDLSSCPSEFRAWIKQNVCGHPIAFIECAEGAVHIELENEVVIMIDAASGEISFGHVAGSGYIQ